MLQIVHGVRYMTQVTYYLRTVRITFRVTERPQAMRQAMILCQDGGRDDATLYHDGTEKLNTGCCMV